MKKLLQEHHCYNFILVLFRGPSTAKDIKKELIQILKSEGINNIGDAVGKGI